MQDNWLPSGTVPVVDWYVIRALTGWFGTYSLFFTFVQFSVQIPNFRSKFSISGPNSQFLVQNSNFRSKFPISGPNSKCQCQRNLCIRLAWIPAKIAPKKRLVWEFPGRFRECVASWEACSAFSEWPWDHSGESGHYQHEWEPGSESATQRHVGSFWGTGQAKIPSIP